MNIIDEIIDNVKQAHPKDYKDIPGRDAMWGTLIQNYGFENVVVAAIKLGCIISKCSNDERYGLGTIWKQPSDALLRSLKRYQRLSHGFCPECAAKALEKVRANRKKN